MTDSKIIITILLPVITGFLFSGFFANELFTNYTIDPVIIENTNQTKILITNSGFLQSKDVFVHMKVNGVVFQIDDNCLEGDLLENNNNNLTFTFSRLSPNLTCEFILTGDTPPSVYDRIVTADNRSAFHYPTSNIFTLFLTALFLILFIEVAVLVFFFKKLPEILFKILTRNYDLSSHAKEINEFLSKEFGKKGFEQDDGTIIQAILNKKTTKNQIVAHTKFLPKYIEFRIELLKKKAVLFEENSMLIPHPVLNEFLKNLFTKEI